MVQTAPIRTLVYDTGPRWSDSADAGSRLIAPYLRASGGAAFTGWWSVISTSTMAAARSCSIAAGRLDADLGVRRRRHVVAARAREVRRRSAIGSPGNGMASLQCCTQKPNYREARTEDQRPLLRHQGQQRNVPSALLTADIEGAQRTRWSATLYGERPAVLRGDVLLLPHHGKP